MTANTPLVALPRYDRSKVTPGIVHIGLGNFHRAHMAVYLDDLMNQGLALDWGILGAGVRAADAKMRDALLAQDCLSTVIELDPKGKTARRVGAMVDFIVAHPNIGAAISYLPPDMADKIPSQYQDPLVVVTTVNVWAFNAEQNETCPVSNIWELTEPKWRGHVAMQDPLGKTIYTDWFNQMESQADAAVAKAYADHFGKPLETDQASATKAWVKALAENGPLLGSSDSSAAEAVGSPGQTEAFMGMMSSAKFRDNVDGGLKLGLCAFKPGLTCVFLFQCFSIADVPQQALLGIFGFFKFLELTGDLRLLLQPFDLAGQFAENVFNTGQVVAGVGQAVAGFTAAFLVL